MSERSPPEVQVLLHPVFIAAVATLALNDHVLKPWFPGSSWTGKLSDIAGLVFFPALAFALTHPWLRRVGLWLPVVRWMDTLAAITAAVFSAIQLSPAAAEAWVWAIGALQLPALELTAWLEGRPSPPWRPVRHTLDPTDLLALPAALWAPWWARRGGAG